MSVQGGALFYLNTDGSANVGSTRPDPHRERWWPALNPPFVTDPELRSGRHNGKTFGDSGG
jgi:hypothetical protein